MTSGVTHTENEGQDDSLRAGFNQTTEQWSWTVFDAGSFGYSSGTLHTVMPVMFTQSAASLAPHEITAVWGYAISTSNFIACGASPCLGAYADRAGKRKQIVVSLVALSIFGTLCAAVMQPTWEGMIPLVVLAMTGYGLAGSMYNSLLVFVFENHMFVTASCISACVSNVGAGFIMAVVLIASAAGAGDAGDKDHLSYEAAMWILCIACLWYAAFTAIFACNVNEPENSEEEPSGTIQNMSVTQRLRNTLSGEEMKSTRCFLVASLFISEGSGTVYHMSVIYALAVCGISHHVLFAATFVNRILGSIFALLWAVAAKRFSARACYMLVCCLMLFALLICLRMKEAWEYWVLAVILSATGSGGFSIGRSLLGSLVPQSKAAEVFGFNTFAGQVAGLSGPLMFSLCAQVTGEAQFGFAVAAVFLIVGMVIFSTIPAEEFKLKKDSVIGHTNSADKSESSYGALPTTDDSDKSDRVEAFSNSSPPGEEIA